METPLSVIPEFLLRKLFYRDLEDLAPSKGIFTDTPMVNNDVLEQIRSGKARWNRGDVLSFTPTGIRFNRRLKEVPKGGPGIEEEIDADVVIMATGFNRPSLGFLPGCVFEEPYNPPNWYLQTFPPSVPQICAINCTYINAIGTVGNYHIGIYTRILLMFLVDPLTTPQQKWMQRWIDGTRYVKQFAPTGAFDFFTYGELIWWFLFCVTINPFRWKWALFVFFGIGSSLPLSIVKGEDRLRNGLGMKNRDD
jgi:hypothetical protein